MFSYFNALTRCKFDYLVYVKLKCCKKKEDILRQNLCLSDTQYGWHSGTEKNLLDWI